MEEQLSDLAERIRRARLRLKESQEDFGKRFGVKQRSTVRGWEDGKPPNAEHLIRLSQFIKDQEQAQGEVHAHQFLLAFDEPINIEFRISPHSSGTLRFAMEIKRKAG